VELRVSNDRMDRVAHSLQRAGRTPCRSVRRERRWCGQTLWS